MDLKKVIEEKTQEALKIKNDKYVAIEKEEKKFELVKNEFNSLKHEIAERLGEERGAIERLIEAIGEKFTIKVRSLNREVVYENQDFELSKGGESVKIGDKYFSLVSKEDCLISVYDEKRKHYIYNNTYLDKSAITQKAYVFGLNSAEADIVSNESWFNTGRTLADYEYRKSCNYIENMGAFIGEGYRYIYPQRREAWDEVVMAKAGDSYETRRMIETLKVLKALNDNSTTVEDAERVLDKYPLDKVLTLVARFSKRGPEFFKNCKFYNSYLKDKEHYQKFIEDIEKENLQFEDELNSSVENN